MTKTPKQALIDRLNSLRKEVDNLPPLTDKKIAKMAVGVVKANIEFYEKEIAAR